MVARELVVSCHNDDFAEAQDAQRAVTAAAAPCGVLRRIAADTKEWAASIDPELPGLLVVDER
jgi:hypothetical protein